MPPVVVVIGDDEVGRDEVIKRFDALVDEDLRPFNAQRFYATDVRPDAVVSTARTFPFMGDRRLVVYLRIEELFKARGRASSGTDTGAEDADAPSRHLQGLEEYVAAPEAGTCLVLAGADVNRATRLGKLLVKHAAFVECWGLKGQKDARGAGAERALQNAGRFVMERFNAEGKRIEPDAVVALVQHAGTEMGRLRGDVERLLLYVANRPAATLEDARAVVGGETSIDDWGVTNAIQMNDAAQALRQLRLALDGGAVPYMVLGQLAWFVRSRLVESAPVQVPAAVDAVFRADEALKGSTASPDTILERLVVELCSVKARGVERRFSRPPGGR
ncbi:MAG: DNA polymerase III subunit delta [Vicinamibacteraceae bacterium]